MNISDIRQYFKTALDNKDFIADRLGGSCIEMIGASFVADEPAIFGVPNKEYIKAEISWYLSQSLNINHIFKKDREPPAAWTVAANELGEINSNYGYLIFSPKNYSQYFRVVSELRQNPLSRRASMIYQRPSMWIEYNKDKKNDFICTNAVTYYIRDCELHCVVQMRSNDVIFGYRNDVAWQRYVMDKMSLELGVHPGTIYWQVQNLHVYDRHYHLIKEHFDAI